MAGERVNAILVMFAAVSGRRHGLVCHGLILDGSLYAARQSEAALTRRFPSLR